VLSDHLSLVLQSHPDVVDQWPDKEVAWRWLQQFTQHLRVAATCPTPTAGGAGTR
tara:strand:- start:1348 stop:1512 length:165 start_codon:yes stop_codon:yes gene_type:complete